jgi:hypothetical protein
MVGSIAVGAWIASITFVVLLVSFRLRVL